LWMNLVIPPKPQHLYLNWKLLKINERRAM
jgi:hypothetical protein